MTDSPFRILQIGLGNRGRMWAKVIGRRSDTVHSGIVEINPAIREAFAQNHPDIPTFPSLTEALIQTQSDAALLVTPPAGHFVQACQILAAGLPLLVEKPLTLDLDEALNLVHEAKRLDLALAVGLNFRYLPVSRKLRELIMTQALGTPGFGHFVYLRHRDGHQPHLNKYPLTMQYPMLLEQSIHHLDLIRYCYGREVVSIFCRTWNPAWSMYAHESNVSCLLTLEGGLEVNYLGTWTGGWNQLQFQWRTDCTDGVIIQRQLFEDLAIARITDTELTPIALPAFQPFYDDTDALLQAFISHLRLGTPLECNGVDHLRTLALCFAAIASNEAGCAINMTDFYRRHNLLAEALE